MPRYQCRFRIEAVKKLLVQLLIPSYDFGPVTLPAATECKKANVLGVLEFPNDSRLVILNQELLNHLPNLLS